MKSKGLEDGSEIRSALDAHVAIDFVLDDPKDIFEHGLSRTMRLHVEIRKRNNGMHQQVFNFEILILKIFFVKIHKKRKNK